MYQKSEKRTRTESPDAHECDTLPEPIHDPRRPFHSVLGSPPFLKSQHVERVVDEIVYMRRTEVEAEAEEEMATDVEEAFGSRPLEQVLGNGSMYGLDGKRWRRQRKGSASAISVLGSVGEDSHGEGGSERERGPASECARSLRKWPRQKLAARGAVTLRETASG